VLTQTRQRLDAGESRKNELGCGTASPDPGCRVTVRYIQVLRAFPPEQVFADAGGFDSTSEPRRWAKSGSPEDDPVAVRDFSPQLSMLDSCTGCIPPSTSLSTQGQGLVPPETLSFHVRDFDPRGHAVRIGATGRPSCTKTIQWRAAQREMAAKRILVEVALTSADVILDVKVPRTRWPYFSSTAFPAPRPTACRGRATPRMGEGRPGTRSIT
jgi:hypothetical protein